MNKYNTNAAKQITILMADDDADDRLLFEEAVEEANLVNEVNFAVDGLDLLDRLKHRGKYAVSSNFPHPDLILLDLNMPRMDGREALAEISNDPQLKSIPVVIMTTSDAEEDIVKAYNLGSSGYITKPVTFEGLIETINVVTDYWVNIVKLPKRT
jgi:two-component system, response regulator